MHELSEGGKTFFDGVVGRRGIFVAAQIGDGPSDVADKPIGAVRVEEAEERIQHPAVDHGVTQLSAVTGDVAESPYGLLAHVRVF